MDRNGRIAVIDETVFHDQGAYVRTHGARVADMTIGLLHALIASELSRRSSLSTDKQDASSYISRARPISKDRSYGTSRSRPSAKNSASSCGSTPP